MSKTPINGLFDDFNRELNWLKVRIAYMQYRVAEMDSERATIQPKQSHRISKCEKCRRFFCTCEGQNK
jgi:hypothetical protein